MKSILKRGRRVLSMALALVLLISGTAYSLSTSALAAGVSYSLHSFIATNCYSDQPVAMKILTSGALVDAGSITIGYPESDLISVSNGRLMAGRVPAYGSDGRIRSVWEPRTYTINGAAFSLREDPNNNEVAVSDPLSITGPFRVEVSYEMDTGISADLLNLPATLAEEAASQITVLNHLISYDKPYMTYMEQMSDSQMGTLYDIMDPESAFASYVTLHSDPQKNIALKESFREVIGEMRTNCYLDDGTLTFFDLLISYEMKGLIHYYQNSASYQAEIALLNQYLNKMLSAENRNGVVLTEADKEYAIGQMVSYAERFGYIEEGVSLDFVDLKENVSAANAMLSAPNVAINLSNNTKLKTLVRILEEEAVEEGDAVGEEGVVQWNPLVTSYGNQMILTQTVGADLNNPADDNNGDNNGDGSGDGSGAGSGDGSGWSPGDGSGSTNVGSLSGLMNAIASAGDGDAIRVIAQITLSEDVSVDAAISLTGADKIDTNGYALTLTDADASVAADAAVSVVSGVEGYLPVKAEDTHTYSLARPMPQTGGKVAGCKNEVLDETCYLFLDIDPINGMTLNALRESFSLGGRYDGTVTLTIAANNGTGLVKTGDRLTVKLTNTDGKVAGQANVVVIVMGDTNCNGKVNTSDAAVTKNISMGKESTLEARMAADVNFSGTLKTPKVNSSDVSFIMAKWFSWELNQYVSNLK